MPNRHQQDIRAISAARLKDARIAAGYKKRSELFDRYPLWPQSTYISHELGRRRFDIDYAIKYAQAFGCNPTFLLAYKEVQNENISNEEISGNEISNEEISDDEIITIPIRDNAAAGVWHGGVESMFNANKKFYVQAARGYPARDQYGRRMIGDDISEHIRDNEYIIFVPVGVAPLITGSIVDVARTRGGLREHTARIFDGVNFTTANHKLAAQVITKPGIDSDGFKTEVVGIAVGAYRDLTHTLPAPLGKKPRE